MKDLRQNYTKGKLIESELPESPFELFRSWFNECVEEEGVMEANAMILSTLSEKGVSSRTVLLKDLRDDAFIFYTNYNSQKSLEIDGDSRCSLLFPWYSLERQVIITGSARKVSKSESEEYFFSRPVSSQIGAWASDQSSEIESRQELDNKLKSLEQRFENEPITMPDHWGGFEVNSVEIEFWQGRENRLHDRIVYRLEGNKWVVKRLQP